MKNQYDVKTSYVLRVTAETKAQAEMIAMDDLCKRQGLGGNWVWNENTDAEKVANPHLEGLTYRQVMVAEGLFQYIDWETVGGGDNKFWTGSRSLVELMRRFYNGFVLADEGKEESPKAIIPMKDFAEKTLTVMTDRGVGEDAKARKVMEFALAHAIRQSVMSFSFSEVEDGSMGEFDAGMPFARIGNADNDDRFLAISMSMEDVPYWVMTWFGGDTMQVCAWMAKNCEELAREALKECSSIALTSIGLGGADNRTK